MLKSFHNAITVVVFKTPQTMFERVYSSQQVVGLLGGLFVEVSKGFRIKPLPQSDMDCSKILYTLCVDVSDIFSFEAVHSLHR